MAGYILALDQGTTSSRAIVFDHAGAVVSTEQLEFRQIFPQPGWVEHDAAEIWATQLKVARNALQSGGFAVRDIAAVGITNQRETTVLWDRDSGKPVHNAIVWQDRRTAEFCDRLKARGLEPEISRKTGLVLDAYFSASKLKWLLDHVPDARARAAQSRLAFGTIDSWLIWNLTGGAAYVTDVSNASRTMLYDIHRGDWDDGLLALFDIPRSVLPRVVASGGVVAQSAEHMLGARIPIAGIAGDQQAALFGQRCVTPGMVKNTYGTGCFMLMHTGVNAVASKAKLLITLACQTAAQREYALEGSVFIGGAVVQWLRDGLGLIKSSAEIETLTAGVKDNGGVYLVPAFAGLGAPHWDPYARGAIFGMTRGTTAAHIARAALESIAFQTADVLEAMRADSGIAIRELRVDGGASRNNMLMQFQADVLGVRVVRSRITETTALGAAYLAGLATGFWRDAAEIDAQWAVDRVFEPQRSRDEATALMSGWKKAVQRAGQWAQP